MSALGPAYAGITRVVSDLGDDDLVLPSGCRGWSVADLVLHVTLDAQRALIALHSPSSAPPDVNALTYWKASGAGPPGGPPGGPSDRGLQVAHGDDAGAADRGHAQFVRRSAAAFARPHGVVQQWIDTAAAAGHAADHADPNLRVATQGHVLTVTDFLKTLITEAALHHLDLIVSLPDAPTPDPAVVAVALSTLDGLATLGGLSGLPSHWSRRESLLKATGRAALTPLDQQTLGTHAALFPLIS